tara:strand:- start:318 stop:590 length:273 start_codon:yes stop_codon:yes gene_type:complete
MKLPVKSHGLCCRKGHLYAFVESHAGIACEYREHYQCWFDNYEGDSHMEVTCPICLQALAYYQLTGDMPTQKEIQEWFGEQPTKTEIGVD